MGDIHAVVTVTPVPEFLIAIKRAKKASGFVERSPGVLANNLMKYILSFLKNILFIEQRERERERA